MEAFILYLKTVCPISIELEKYIRENLHEKFVPKNKFILKAGRIAQDISFIQSGLVRCFYEKGMQDISIWFMKEFDVFVSVASFFDQKQSLESIQALENTTMFSMGYAELQLMYRTFPEANFIGRVLTEKYYKLSEERLMSLRRQSGEERYAFMETHYPELIQRVQGKYLATYLGLSQVRLSIIKSQWRRKKRNTD